MGFGHDTFFLQGVCGDRLTTDGESVFTVSVCVFWSITREWNPNGINHTIYESGYTLCLEPKFVE